MAREQFGDPIKPEEMSLLSSSTRQEGDLPVNIDADARRKHIPLGSPLAIGIVKDPPFHPSPSLNEGLIDGIEGAEDFAGYLAPAKNALSHASESLKSIDAAWQALRSDQSKSELQKAMVLAPAAIKKQEAILRVFSKASEDLDKAVELIEKELSAPVVAAATASPTNAELRTVIRNMPKAEREALIDTAVREGDTTVTNAVLGVHPLITGVDPLRHSMWTRQIREKANPELVRRLAATKKAIEVIERAAPIALKQVEQAMRANFADVAKAQKMADASAEALAALAAHRGA